MSDIEDSMYDLAKLAVLADALRNGIEGARKQYELAVAHRLDELQRIEHALDQAALNPDMTVDEYRRLCRSLCGQLARLRGFNKVKS